MLISLDSTRASFLGFLSFSLQPTLLAKQPDGGGCCYDAVGMRLPVVFSFACNSWLGARRAAIEAAGLCTSCVIGGGWLLHWMGITGWPVCVVKYSLPWRRHKLGPRLYFPRYARAATRCISFVIVAVFTNAFSHGYSAAQPGRSQCPANACSHTQTLLYPVPVLELPRTVKVVRLLG